MEENTTTVCLRWVDSRIVSLISSYVGADPVSQARRWNRKEKKYEEIQRPAIVSEYNKFMGGIDLLNMCTSMYKYNIRSRRWYLYIFWHSVTMAIVNAWFLHRRYNNEHSTDSTNFKMPLRKFQGLCAKSLTSAGQGKKRGRPSIEERAVMQTPQRKKIAANVTHDMQKDLYDHLPVWDKTRQRCQVCPSAIAHYSYVKCVKCQVHLCLNKDRNCFLIFHK